MLDNACICAEEPVVDSPAPKKSPAAIGKKNATSLTEGSGPVVASRNVSFAADASRNAAEARDGSEAGSDLETDYDVQPTDLYKLVEKRKWDEAIGLLDCLPKYAALGQASTWVVRRDPQSGKLRWRLLPLHAVIIFRGPLKVVQALLKAYPGAAQCRDDQGMTPAHLAFRNDAADDVLVEILKAHPAAIAVQDRKKRTPLQCATGSANCSLKSRAQLLDTYSSMVRAEEQKSQGDPLTKEQMTQMTLDHAREVEEGAAREAILTDKVEELTRALEAVTASRRAEAVAHTNAAARWSAMERDVLDTLGGGRGKEEGQEGLSNDVIRSCVDDLVTSHRRLQAERDTLAERNDVLESLLERTVAERDDVGEILTKLEQDMTAAQTVRSRMVAAIAKQETDVHGLATRKHEAMRDILDGRK